MSKSVFAPLVALAAAMGSTAMPATVFAETPSNSVGVDYADLDLATPKGQRTLERRIARAARTICGLDDTVTGSRLQSPQSLACYDQAVRSARTRVADAVRRKQAGG